ncbi:MAG: class I SAM-dependent methyltransferase [Sulfuricurvum sp.]|nr:class I SAM-dependent methyltransferase [Sulfuricurvum sp.]
MHKTNHFDSIAEVFNQVWHFSDAYKNFLIEHIISDLDLTAQDILVDIGGGTGTFTSRLKNEAQLQKAYCVEPSSAMCAEASHYPEITAICADAHHFLSTPVPYTKVLFKEVIHHIDAQETLWEHLLKQLPPEGKILIITRPQETHFPFFQSAKEAFARNQPPVEAIVAQLEMSGFTVTTTVRDHTFTLLKTNWYEMLRHRFMSDLGHFSDEEIEAGIDELNQIYHDDTIDICDHLIFITASKK